MAKARKPKSASTPTSSAKGAVGVDKRALMADALANGADDAAVLDHLIANGISSSAARYEVERLARDPMAAALRKMAERQAKGEWVMTLADRLTRKRMRFNCRRLMRSMAIHSIATIMRWVAP